jgi:PAS domain S-box-containing protein
MKIAQKIDLNNFFVIAFLAAIIGVSIMSDLQRQKIMVNMVEVEQPLQQAAFELENNIDEYAETLFHFVSTLDERDINRIDNSRENFEHFASVIKQLTTSESVNEYFNSILISYDMLASTGDTIIQKSRQRILEFERFNGLAVEIDQMYNEGLQLSIDRVEGSLGARLNRVFYDIDMLAGINPFDFEINPTLFGQLTGVRTDLERLQTLFLGTDITTEEADLLSSVSELFETMIASGSRSIALTSQIKEHIEGFQFTHSAIDRMFDENLQVTIIREIQNAVQEQKDFSKNAVFVIFAIGLALTGVLLGLTRVLTKKVGDGVTRLSAGAAAFGQGNFGHRVEIQTKDELGELADAFNDMADRREKHELMLLESEEHFQTVFNTVTTGTIEIGTKGIIEIFNPAAEAIFGFKSKEVVGKNISMLMPEPDRSKHDSYIQNYLETGKANIIGFGRQVTGLRSNGKEFPMQLHIGKMVLGDDTRFVGSVSDLTDVKSLEGQLRQLQKVEAIGHLTGGVAHDFNNLLAIIQGNLMLLKMDMEAGEKKVNEEDFEHAIDEALDASVRGASLTSRLLAFSRQQVLNPEITHIDKAVKGVRSLLERTLGEDISISWELNANWLANIDSAQLGNALLNLAINARDAMPQGGKLTIATSDVNLDEAFVSATVGAKQGEHVKLSVGDSGTGMDDETLQQAIDPFFTTKGVGKGTGLGLSMVYGFVKQSGGYLHIDSQVGEGTTLTICLPRAEGVITEKAGDDDQAGSSGGPETILIVEDDQGVRKVTVRMLKRLGYVVIEAVNGPTAIKAIESNSAIDLIISDIVLPGGMRGTEIVNLARSLRPKLKVIFISGYTDGALMEQRDRIPDQAFLRKPFSPADLATKVREALDRPKSLII